MNVQPGTDAEHGQEPSGKEHTPDRALSHDEGGTHVSEIDADSENRGDDDPEVTLYELRSAPHAKRVRLDQFITRHVENASRSKVKQLIDAGGVTVNGEVAAKAGRLVLPGDHVICTIPKPPPPEALPENIALDIVYEDDAVLVVNKPAGMVTHPAYTHYSGTLVNALLYYTTRLSGQRGEDRPGILHRLDKDTSGLLAVAKTDTAHTFIARQFADHSIRREYRAIVWGSLKNTQGVIDAPLGRHNSDRKKMTVREDGKRAVTEYTVLRDYGDLSVLRLRLQTGRTHQIRVHLSHLRHPVLGDATYGGRRILYGNVTPRYKQLINDILDILPRQALHALTLGFIHPVSREEVYCTSDLPADMTRVLELLEDYYIEEASV